MDNGSEVIYSIDMSREFKTRKTPKLGNKVRLLPIPEGRIGHDDNQSVLLEVERSWIKIPLQAKSVKSAIWKDHRPADSQRVCHQLDDDTADCESWCSKTEQSIESGGYSGKEHSDDLEDPGISNLLRSTVKTVKSRMCEFREPILLTHARTVFTGKSSS